MVNERCVEMADGRNIEPVEPDDRIGTGIAVVVPMIGRRQDEVAVVHRRTLAVDRSISARAGFQYQAHRRLAVPVSGSDLAGMTNWIPA